MKSMSTHLNYLEWTWLYGKKISTVDLNGKPTKKKVLMNKFCEEIEKMRAIYLHAPSEINISNFWMKNLARYLARNFEYRPFSIEP